MSELRLMEPGKEVPLNEWATVSAVVLAQGREIERLKTENADLRQANASHQTASKHYYEKLEKALAEGRALAQERDAALADSERLTWMIEHDNDYDLLTWKLLDKVYELDDYPGDFQKDVRRVIDNLRGQQ